jgi:hypothetical protein
LPPARTTAREAILEAVEIAQSSAGTAKVVGRPFPRGTSGNPSGRPRGLTRRVRELVGDGEAIIQFLIDTMNDPTVRRRDRLDAARMLFDRGWGRPLQAVDLSVNQVTLEDLFRGIATEDLEAMIAIYEKYGVVELVESGEVSRVAGSA